MLGLASFAAWTLFIYHFWIVRETGYQLSAPAMASLLALTALVSTAPPRLRRTASERALRAVSPQWRSHSRAATYLAAMLDDRTARTPLMTQWAGPKLREASSLLSRVPQIARASKFMLVGASGVVVNLGLLWLGTSVFGIDERAAWAIAVECSLLSNFMLNRTFTWRTERANGAMRALLEGGRYHVACAAGICANFAVFTATRWMSCPALFAGFLGIIAGMALNFTGCVHFVFRASGMTRVAEFALDPAAVAADEQPLPSAAKWGS